MDQNLVNSSSSRLVEVKSKEAFPAKAGSGGQSAFLFGQSNRLLKEDVAVDLVLLRTFIFVRWITV